MEKFIIIEPSKAGAEHLTFNASVISELLRQAPGRVLLASSKSHFEALGRPVATFCALPIVSIVQRRFFSKMLVEACAILKAYWNARRHGAKQALVLSVFPPLLSWLGLIARLFEVPTTLVLHGELEGLVDPARQHVSSFGYWVKRFFVKRGFQHLKCFVLSEGIYERLISLYPNAAGHVGWGNHPITPGKAAHKTVRDIAFATVGVATARKHTELFQELRRLGSSGQKSAHIGMSEAELFDQFKDDIIFLCTPGTHLSQADFVAALERVKNAVFPYSQSSYRMAVSGAMLDAIGCGCNVLCMPNVFAQDLVNAGLPVTVASGLTDLLREPESASEREAPWDSFSASAFCERLVLFAGANSGQFKTN